MALSSGTRLGIYEIAVQIGEGGMGAVYRATDTSLGRQVAIKVLPDAFAADPARLARFEREAKTLAALNHPHIAAVHGFEKAAGHHALVMELVEGDDLSERVARGPIPLDEAIAIATQIAEALEAAHEQGIVHRDLKPANIKVRPDGTVKVLDFGLAKAVERAGESGGAGRPGGAAGVYRPDAPDRPDRPDLSASPTLTSPALMTGAGVILGTAAYMAPEQARGRTVDRRADIWAFGVVLYEMLTGRRAFPGDDVTDTIVSVVSKEPDWTALPSETPARLRRLLVRCLQKDPKRRMRDIGDVRIELESADEQQGTAEAVPEAVRTPRFQRVAWAGWVVAVATLGYAAVAGVRTVPRTAEADAGVDPIRFEIQGPDEAAVTGAAISPDGRRLAFTVRNADGKSTLWVRALSSLEDRALPGTDGASSPFWSPDGRAIAFVSAGATVGNAALKTIDPAGGAPFTICALTGQFGGGTWSSDGVILYGILQGGLWRVSDKGGTPSAFTTDRGIMPAMLPDNRHFLYTRAGVDDVGGPSTSGALYVGSLDDPPAEQGAKELLAAQSGAAYVPSSDPRLGFLLFLRDRTLLAQRFDVERLALVGEPTPIARGTQGIGTSIAVSAAPNAIVFRDVRAVAESRLLWFDRQGKLVGEVGPPGRYGDVRLSPDGRLIVLDSLNESGLRHVWTVDTKRQAFGLLNPDSTGETGQAVSRDGRIAFTTNTDGNLSVKAASGAGDPQVLVTSANLKHPNDWSPDGGFVLYDAHHPTRNQDLYVVPLSGDRTPVPFVVTPANETHAAFSPDGRWIAYNSDESGRSEVYVRDFAPDRAPATGSTKVPISTHGGFNPRWNPNGRELYYLALDGTMMAVSVSTGKGFEAEVPVALFKTNATGFFSYDVAADGRFLVNTLTDPRRGTVATMSTAGAPMTVVLHWQEELKRLVSTK